MAFWDPSAQHMLGRMRFSVTDTSFDTVFITMENAAQKNSG